MIDIVNVIIGMDTSVLKKTMSILGVAILEQEEMILMLNSN